MSVTVMPQARTTPATITASAALMPTTMGDVVRLAEIMASAKMVPKHLQGQTGDCFMVIEQAMRWNMSPFAVAQATSSISGKLMFEGKLVAAAVETSGAITGFMDYEFFGEGDNRSIRAWATRRGETTPRDVTVCFKDVRTENGMWKKQPDQQLVYSASRIWARRWTPAVILGVYAPEEFEQPHREPAHRGPEIEHTPSRPAVDAVLSGDSIPTLDPAPPGSMREFAQQHVAQKPKPRTAVEKFGDRIAELPDRAACATFLDEGTPTGDAFRKRSDADQAIIRDMLADKMGEFLAGPTPVANEDDFPGVTTPREELPA